ncbi:MAG: hypothetical protein PHG63_04030, partial [Candidatus Dojkabacteria bacterium]|nr:hypothetical protein [Candidatus Dojkabacteria bacterium]
MDQLIQESLVYAQTVGPTAPVTGQTQQEVVTQPGISRQIDASDAILPALFLFFIVTLGVITYLTLRYLKLKDRDEKAKDWALYEVRVAKDNEIEIGVAEQLYANLSGIGGGGKGMFGAASTVKHGISFEIVGLPDAIRFYIYCPRKLASWVEKQVLGSYQDADFEEAEEYNIFHEDGTVSFASLELTDESYQPLKTAESFEGDPMANLTSALSKFEHGEGAVIQMVISPAGSRWSKNGRKFVSRVESNNSDPEKKRINVSQEQLQAISKKCSYPGFSCALRIVAVAKDEAVAKMHLNNIVGTFDQFSNPGSNELKRSKISAFAERDFMKSFLYRYPAMTDNLVLNAQELAVMIHFPNKEVKTPNIHWLLSREAPA